MKPYFAKYLPVVDEIREGDIIIYPNLQHSVPVQWLGGDLTGYEKKVKLFLCSRDIQVGDKARWVARPDIESIVTEEILDIHLNHGGGLFKAIGEISPEATWVKESDEFERNDFEMRWVNSIGKWSLTMKEVDTEEDSPVLIAFIKGPCGHFH